MWGVLRHPSRFITPGGKFDGDLDIAAIEAGGSRRVSCFLRGTFDGLPRKLKQGTLVLSEGDVSWKPYWDLRKTSVDIRAEYRFVSTRDADEREPRVKRGGKAHGVVAVPSFSVVSCSSDDGTVDFVVPAVDEALVVRYFKDRLIS